MSLPGGLVASGSDDWIVRVWEVEIGRLVRTMTGHTGPVLALAVLPDGLLASASVDKTVRMWEVESGRLVRTLAGHTGWVLRSVVVWRVADGVCHNKQQLTVLVNKQHGPLFATNALPMSTFTWA